jgi:outer membrane protein OmpA-like peptidoglycan-associated protein
MPPVAAPAAVAPPPVSELTPRPPVQTAAAAGQGAAHLRPAVSYQVSEIHFPSGSAALGSKQDAQLGEVIKLHKSDGGTIRVIGYAEQTPGGAAVDQEASAFALALERAQAVASGLSARGIPANAVSVEAAPARPGVAESPRVEVYFER